MQWISVKDRLPENKDDYFIKFDWGGGIIKKAVYWNGEYFTTPQQRWDSEETEWLDESPTPSLTEEEVEKMAIDFSLELNYQGFERSIAKNGFIAGYKASQSKREVK